MPNIYGGGGSVASPTYPTYKPPSAASLGLGSQTLPKPPTSEDDELDAGKFTIDLTDPLGSLGESIGSAAGFGSGLIGGVAGAVGSLGPDADTASIGQLAEDIGRIPGGIGDIQLRYLGDDPTRTNARLSDVPDLIGDVISTPGRLAQRAAAGGRVHDYLKQDALERAEERNPLPADLQARIDQGADPEAIADELIARDAGFSSGPAEQVLGSIVLDPLNLIAPGASKAAQATRGAGVAVRAADDLSQLGIGTRAAGTAYNAAAKGLSHSGAALVDKVLGPTTSGVFHAIGTKPYRSIVSGLGKIEKSHAEEFERAFALGAAQMPRAVLANYMSDEAATLIRRGADALPSDVSGIVERRLDVARSLAPDDLERRSQELLQRVAPTFDGMSDEALTAATVQKLAAIVGTSTEDATRVLGRVDRQTAQAIHLAYYGKAGDDLAHARRSIATFDPRAKGMDASRLTLVAPDTLTTERAAELLQPGADLTAAVERYGVLTNRFLGKDADGATIRAFVKKLVDEDALITTVRKPTTGAHALPKPLGEWRRKYADSYELGFAPEKGWTVVTDEDGAPVLADAFVHFASDADPVTMRNPLGRFMDSLFRGTTQTTIVQESRQRLTDEIVKRGLPISPAQGRAIHHAILEEAAGRGVTPRSLVGESVSEAAKRTGVIDAIFKRFLTAGEYAAVKDEIDPVFLVLSAFQGRLGTVGLTQYVTGGAKRLPGLGPMATVMAESIYPRVRFALNPLFQLQELVESPFLNAMRGVVGRKVDPDIAKVYAELTDLPELRYLAESGYVLHLASGESVKRFLGVNTPVGRALARFSDVAGKKDAARIRQVLSEHGPEFKRAVETINPRAWRAMEDAYGTKDPRIIADRFMAERFAIGPGEDVADAMRAFDAAWQPTDSSAAAETVWQAWRSTFEQASRQAFQTHFFRPQRGWLERTANHPYLGIYPLSYMAKVGVEFTRFLLRRPFGLDAPLVGFTAVEKVQRAYVAAVADDREFRAWLQDHPDAMYLATALIPGDPTSLGMGAPAWARHVSEDATAGRDITVETVGREVQDSAGYAFGAVRGPVTLAEGAIDLVGAAGDVFAILDRAAREYDGQF